MDEQRSLGRYDEPLSESFKLLEFRLKCVCDLCVNVLEKNAKEGEHFLMHVFSSLNELKCLILRPEESV
jgi:hypothetical protein